MKSKAFLNYKYTLTLLLFFTGSLLAAQNTDANLFGDARSNGEHLPFVNIFLEGTTLGTTTDATGHYILVNLPTGSHVVVAKALGYKTLKKTVLLERGKTIELNFEMEESSLFMNEHVVTGTKTFKRQTESAVIVNVLERKSLDMVQACNISEGLRFQPGLRVETDCQTCNYTQLRMNGLGGGYSQILINGRAVFSPLTGLYGMEQFPANMIERIEVVRGGGSALYGSSAIGGTVNIITTIPKESSFNVSQTLFSINGEAMDNVLNGNLTMVNQKRNAGAAIFVNRRAREAYDHPGYAYENGLRSNELQKDGFSELPELKNNSFGANLFFNPTVDQKIELNFTSLQEYRIGGETGKPAAHLAQQSEERTHNVLMGGLDYQINFNDDNSSFIAYVAGQSTNRLHYTGIIPDKNDHEAYENHFKNPPYGYTENYTLQGGTQLNHRFNNFLGGLNVITVGGEYILDDVFDTIPAYNYETDQRTITLGGFIQSDWEITRALNLLSGIRVDKHNLIDYAIASPRVSLLFKHQNMQLRGTWGTGFRAPQAFDADLHIAFAGGGISRVILSDDLREERSNSLSGSINYDRPSENVIFGFTIEGFYTNLKDVFYLQPEGEDAFGVLYKKQNGSGASVAGTTIELRGNYNRKLQLEAGFTLQKSEYEEAVENIEGLEPTKTFLRTPDQYGYWTFSYTPNAKFNASLSSVYTGPMLLAKYSPDPLLEDSYVTTKPFNELNLKVAYTIPWWRVDSGLEIFGGIKNFTNQYQNDFDNGKNRDSNYIYGPALPRTFYVGISLKSL